MYGFSKSADFIKAMDWHKLVFSIFLLLLFIVLISIAIAPRHKLYVYEKLAENDSALSIRQGTAGNLDAFSEKLMERSFKESLLELGEKDSIQMAVNLTDSTVCLYINGVKIHQTPITYFDEDKLLKKLSNSAYIKIFSKPLEINQTYATIVKEPIVIRQAPKDTAEANLNAWKPDTLVQNPAYILFDLDLGIRLIFEQEITSSFGERWSKFGFYRKLWTANLREIFYHLLHFTQPDYKAAITIKMPADDLRAIYRALPQRAYVVIYLSTPETRAIERDL